MTLLLLAATGVAQLFGAAVLATYMARIQTSTTVFASQKVEELRARDWSDSALSTTAATQEFLDARGGVVSAGSTAPPAARFIRRWSIRPLPEDSINALIIEVLVTTLEAERRATLPRRPMAGDALITTILARQPR